jgi:mono/diheme cytochrome c family protein
VFAIAAYVLTLRSGAKPTDEAQDRTDAAKLEWGHQESPPVPQDMSEGARVFQKSCVMCHRSNGATIPLALQSSVHAPDASSVAHAITNGITPPTGALGRSMPAFAGQLTEAETVAVLKFVRSRYSKGGAWSGVESAVKDARAGK